MCKSGQDNSEELKEKKVFAVAEFYKIPSLLHFLTSTVAYV